MHLFDQCLLSFSFNSMPTILAYDDDDSLMFYFNNYSCGDIESTCKKNHRIDHFPYTISSTEKKKTFHKNGINMPLVSGLNKMEHTSKLYTEDGILRIMM